VFSKSTLAFTESINRSASVRRILAIIYCIIHLHSLTASVVGLFRGKNSGFKLYQAAHTYIIVCNHRNRPIVRLGGICDIRKCSLNMILVDIIAGGFGAVSILALVRSVDIIERD
jgi:hypothetical protein